MAACDWCTALRPSAWQSHRADRFRAMGGCCGIGRVLHHSARRALTMLGWWRAETMPVTELARKYVGFLDVPAPNFLIVDGAHSARYAWGPDNGRKGRVFPKEDQMMSAFRPVTSESAERDSGAERAKHR